MRIAKYVPVGGGTNLVGAPLQIPPGQVIYSRNYEPDTEGNYQRVAGYERHDGQPSPSDASYWTLAFDAGSVEPSVGDIIRGNTSEALGELLVTVALASGTWAGGDAAGNLILGGTSGTFVDDEVLETLGASAGFDSGFSSGFS